MFEAQLIGNVGSSKFVAVGGGKMPVLNISLASSRKVGDREYTDWVSCKVWGERAEKLDQHVNKGTKLLVRGRPEAKGFTKGDGTPGAELILHVDTLEFLSPKPKAAGDHEGESPEMAHAETAASEPAKTQRRRG
jgi:single-strand DNA-binding protein